MSERWKPGKNDLYFFISSAGDIIPDRADDDFASCNGRLGYGNYFRSRAEAAAAAKKIKALLLSLHYKETLQPTCNNLATNLQDNLPDNLPDNAVNLPDNGEIVQADMRDKQLPKLTAEVFDRPDCPEWAQYAAVDRSGDAYYFTQRPYINAAKNAWLLNGFPPNWRFLGHAWDTTDWQNSLIERPARLPDWCKVGEWVYDKAINKYSQVATEDVTEGLQEVRKIIFKGEIVQARLRPFNADEMKALVGKVIEDKDGDCYLIYKYDATDNTVETSSCFVTDCYLLKDYTLDGKPCGVLEHLENGEWVK